MSIWFALLVPLIGAFIMLKWFRKHLAWWEVVIPLIACMFFIFIFKLIVEKIEVSDTEYHGALIVSARYIEPYTTWEHRTCSYTISCGKNCTRRVYYDCSYCDENGPEWEVTNSLGRSWNVTKEHYEYLMKKWSAKPSFVELNRDIDYHGGCGQDGDAYEIKWDKQPLTSESTTTSESYENRVQAAHTAFDFPEITDQDKITYKLYDYPEVEGYSQKTVLGLDSLKWVTPNEKARMNQWATFLNGQLGVKKHARIYFLFFADMPQIAANMQEAYWDGGNDNELVICIGLSKKSKEIQWVKPFTWSPSRQIIPDVREGIMKKQNFNVDQIANTTWHYVDSEFKRKDFKEFSYITVDPPGWSKWVTWIMTILITGGLCYWAIVNDYISDPNDPIKTITNWDNYRRRF